MEDYMYLDEVTRPVGELFKQAGLSEADVQILRAMRDEGGAMFAHGSGLTGELSETSDLDFAVISPFLGDYLTATYGIDGDAVDYLSMSKRAANGRKLSMHVAKPSFRENYGNRPYAVEFRPAANMKAHGGRSKYELVGMTQDGQMYALDMICPQRKVEGVGVFNLTPQTGLFDISGNQAHGYVEATGTVIEEPYDIGKVWKVDEVTGMLVPHDEPIDGRLFLWGLEANKSTSDVPLFKDDEPNYGTYVEPVMRNSVRMAQQFVGSDPTDKLVTMMVGHSIYRNTVAGRKKADPEYVRQQGYKLAKHVLQ